MKSRSAFYFASEAKSLLAIRPELRAFDLRGLGEWLSCGAALENRSLFRGIECPPCGLSVGLGVGMALLERRTYFSPDTWENHPKLGPAEFYSKLRSTFVRRLPAYLRSDGPIGLSDDRRAGHADDPRQLRDRTRTASTVIRSTGPVGRISMFRSAGMSHRPSGLPHTTIRITTDFFRQFGRTRRGRCAQHGWQSGDERSSEHFCQQGRPRDLAYSADG